MHGNCLSVGKNCPESLEAQEKELPADEQREANYNGEIMLDSWLRTFRSYSDGARSICSLIALKPFTEVIACLSRNTTPTEGTLRAIKNANARGGVSRSIEHLNDTFRAVEITGPAVLVF